MSRIGVFICHCGENISATVDCERVAKSASEMREWSLLPTINICVPTRDNHL